MRRSHTGEKRIGQEEILCGCGPKSLSPLSGFARRKTDHRTEKTLSRTPFQREGDAAVCFHLLHQGYEVTLHVLVRLDTPVHSDQGEDRPLIGYDEGRVLEMVVTCAPQMVIPPLTSTRYAESARALLYLSTELNEPKVRPPAPAEVGGHDLRREFASQNLRALPLVVCRFLTR